MSGDSVSVRFVTTIEEYALSSNEFDVPTIINRKGLSAALNSALELESPVPFDFKIRGNFLRSTLGQAIKEYGISTEKVVIIEYFPAYIPPKPEPEQETDDWISALAYDEKGELFYGLYNCTVGSTSGKKIEIPAACKSLATMGDSVLAGDIQGNVTLINESESHTYTLHQGAVTSIATNKSVNHLFITAGDDSVIGMWSTADSGSVPLNSFIGHKAPISKVVWSEPNVLVSASQDRTLRTWDVNTQQETVAPIQLSTAILDCDVRGSMVICSHPDRSISLIDLREEERKSVVRVFKSHSNWVSKVKFVNDEVFASGSYDGSVKTWNIGTTVPLSVLSQHDEKIFAIATNGDEIAFGGSGNVIRRFH